MNKLVVGLAATGAAFALGAIALGASGPSKDKATGPTPSGGAAGPSPVGGPPWAVVQGHRYVVKASAAAVDFSKANGSALPAGFAVVGGPANITTQPPGFLYYLLDVTAPSHEEPAATFLLGVGKPGDPILISMQDAGPIPGASPAPPALPPPALPPVAVASTWLPATSVSFLQRARLSMTGAQVSAFFARNGLPAPDLTKPEDVRGALTGALVSAPPASSALRTHLFFCWAPGAGLPTDWPPDDAHAVDGYHVELVYGVTLALTLATTTTFAAGAPTLAIADLHRIGLDVSGLWADTGPVPSVATGAPIGGAVTWTRTATANPGAHLRVSFLPADYPVTVNAAFAALGDAGCISLLAQADAGLASIFGADSVLVWCVGDPLPPDWPGDAGGVATAIHFEFRFGGASPVALPPPMVTYAAQGAGA